MDTTSNQVEGTGQIAFSNGASGGRSNTTGGHGDLKGGFGLGVGLALSPELAQKVRDLLSSYGVFGESFKKLSSGGGGGGSGGGGGQGIPHIDRRI